MLYFYSLITLFIIWSAHCIDSKMPTSRFIDETKEDVCYDWYSPQIYAYANNNVNEKQNILMIITFAIIII